MSGATNNKTSNQILAGIVGTLDKIQPTSVELTSKKSM